MARIRVAACQINTVVGDLAGNVDRTLEALAEAETAGADLAAFPELTVTGYPPEDLLGRPAFVADNLVAFRSVVAATGACAAVIGYVDIGPQGRLLNAAPYCRGRREERLAVLSDRTAETGCPVVYVNQVGGQDELVFDGASLVVDRAGRVIASAHPFVEEVLICDLELDVDPGAAHAAALRVSTMTRAPAGAASHPVAAVLDPVAEVYEALVLGTCHYLGKNGFTDAVIGLSGGIDSSLVAAVAVDAIGRDHVHGVALSLIHISEP